ncbi:hypothetical protein MVEN_00116900 [Mycena venus]|uniref:Uncharacterized protein n=1 Tax=Mycena venus TaxID=2733690 RepID=A0A8H6ZBA8_9AGAR|nr:hypothetical protein MVEN_00116900 [Mycena venus]
MSSNTALGDVLLNRREGTPPGQIPSDTPFTTGSLSIQLVGDDARHAILAAQNSDCLPAAVATGPTQRLFLNPIPHEDEDGWKLAKKMPIEDLAPWFDDLHNDFTVHTMHPKQDFPPSLLREQTADDGNKAGMVDEEDEGDEMDLNCDDDEAVVSKVRPWTACSTLVKLHAEVYASDLGTVFVWQQHEHPDVPLADCAQALQFSRLQRSIFLESLRLHGIKVSALVIETQRLPPAALGRTTPLPPWREATSRELESMHVAVKQRELLDRNPWRATHLIVKANKDKIYRYVPHDFSKPDLESKFTIGLTDEYSLDSAIAYTLDDGGLGK